MDFESHAAKNRQKQTCGDICVLWEEVGVLGRSERDVLRSHLQRHNSSVTIYDHLWT